MDLIRSAPNSSGSKHITGTAIDAETHALDVAVKGPITVAIDGGVSITGPLPVTDNAGSLTVDDGGSSLTVDGTVAISGAVPVTDNGGSLTVDGTIAVSNFPAAQPVTDNGGSLTVDDGGGSLTVDGTVTVTDGAGSLTVDGTVTANVGTTGGLALDATLTGGTQKAVVRGGAKGGTSAADVTSTVVDADHQALDVSVQGSVPVTDNGGSLTVDGTVTVADGGGSVSVDDNAGSLTVDDGGGSLTVDGTVAVTGVALDATLTGGTQKAIVRGAARGTTTAKDATVTNVGSNNAGLDVNIVNAAAGVTMDVNVISASGVEVTVVDGALGIAAGGNLATVSAAGALKVDGSAVTQPVSGTVTANVGTTGGLALDATLTGGTQKAITRGGAKGGTAAADVTSTSIDADHQGLDVKVQGAVPVTDNGGLISVDDGAGSLTVDGTVTANVGTTGGLALDATLTGGTQKAIVRGAAKGSTTAKDATVTSVGSNNAGLDVNIVNAAAGVTMDVNVLSGAVEVSGITGSVSTFVSHAFDTTVMKTGSLATTATTANQVVLTYTVTFGRRFHIKYLRLSAFLTTLTGTATVLGTISLERPSGTKVFTATLIAPTTSEVHQIDLDFGMDAITAEDSEVVRVVVTPAVTTSITWEAAFGGYERQGD